MSSIEYINSVVLTDPAANLSFSNIPQHYQDLLVTMSAVGVGGTNGLRLRLNDDNSTNYSATFLFGNGSSAGSNRESNTSQLSTAWLVSTTTGNSAVLEINILSYSNTSIFKTLLINTGKASESVESNVGLWRSTSAINKITLAIGTTFPSFNLASTTNATLWGVR